MVNLTGYIVLRGGPLDGEWIKGEALPPHIENIHAQPAGVYEPTDEFEFREDGACAQVFRFNNPIEQEPEESTYA